ncbi:hypothetical protein CSUI_006945 [Cystoisospora suis]|uniref:Uncharacterized protein n=1 Tax=Cystoisospora suis TaxID=483139 RepID=A0A2C6KFF9_9APIC|nr:hypothetical protein CSUI_006945 [Cystoisospora suis]
MKSLVRVSTPLEKSRAAFPALFRVCDAWVPLATSSRKQARKHGITALSKQEEKHRRAPSYVTATRTETRPLYLMYSNGMPPYHQLYVHWDSLFLSPGVGGT